MKIGYFSPLSPVKSGISEYSEREVLPYIQNYFDIDLIIDNNYVPSNQFIKENFKIIPYDQFENKYDLLVYHIGNNPFHEYMYKIALKYPGLIILHDPFLHHLQIHMTVAQQDEEGYRKIMEYCLGQKGKKIAENALISYVWPHFDYPLVKEVVDVSKAVVVHSNFARDVILRESKKNLIKQIKMPITIPSISKKYEMRKKLQIPKDCLVIGSFGHVGFYKRLDVALKAFSKFVKSKPNSIFLIVGSFQTKEFEKEVHYLIKQLGIEDKVIETGYVSDLFSYVHITDIAIQLRYPTAGETSIITLQIMGLGKPILVSNVGSFRELPETALVKIDVDEREEISILKGFEALSDSEYRNRLGQTAQKYIKKEHDPQKNAYEFFDFVSYVNNNEKLKMISKSITNPIFSDLKNLKSQDLFELAKKLHQSLK